MVTVTRSVSAVIPSSCCRRTSTDVAPLHAFIVRSTVSAPVAVHSFGYAPSLTRQPPDSPPAPTPEAYESPSAT
jgi:hypothetical protein